jgi:hypothetical protein
MKSFVFLYPIPEYFKAEIQRWGWRVGDGFKEKYSRMLNQCIDARYRQKGFEICYAIFDNHEISDIVNLQPDDKIIPVGIDFKTHTADPPVYPDPDIILAKLGNPLRIGGFHMWDCVQKVAQRAYEKGIDTLVDEDLTEFFAFKVGWHDSFAIDRYPSDDPRKRYEYESDFEFFMRARRGKPWLWQDY